MTQKRWMSVVSLVCAAWPVQAQEYPNKLVRIVTLALGGGSDVVARLTAPMLSEALGQQVIVENRGAVASEVVAKSPADGYTLLVEGSPLWVLPLFRSVTWDAVKDFAPITLIVSTPSVLVVHSSLPVKTTQELIALARAKPGQLNYAAGTLGANPHLAAELFKSLLNLNIAQVAYKGTGPGLIGLMGGEVELMFPNAGSALPHIKSGRLRILGVASLQPSVLLPGVPTVASTVPGFESISPQGLLAPANTPPAIINRLNRDVLRGITRPEVKERFINTGAELAGGTPEEFSGKIKSDIVKFTRLVQEGRIKKH
ncbi:MAG: tripartite tricarboxylate transporter substrate binding protein [Betaproteobacteria bacterium]|nr:tripartite tricarboxylate transporter substrate binding protein [Betaproteobacteria bacterium]